MRNIFKGFLNPPAQAYVLPEADSLVVEEALLEEFDQEPAEEESAPPVPEDTGEEQDVPEEEEGEALEEPAPPPPSPEEAPVQYAQLQAELILKQAREEAEQILVDARAAAKREQEEIRAGARDEGYRVGYAEGTAKAMEDAVRDREIQAERLEGEVAAFLEKASLAREEMLAQSQEELLDLVIAVAEKVVRVSLKSSADVIVRMIQTATERMKRQEWVHIYISGCDARGAAQISPALTSTLGALSQHVKVVPMGDGEDGTCIVETPEEIIDASVSTQMSTIRDILHEQLGAQF
ncbi:MAG: F0F1 ATP synthase subunit delta [Oscillospiraceae bacterium]|nr:F0F1 ATP synthase subunit delta [Oscillospiraceae bacterium]